MVAFWVGVVEHEVEVKDGDGGYGVMGGVNDVLKLHCYYYWRCGGERSPRVFHLFVIWAFGAHVHVEQL